MNFLDKFSSTAQRLRPNVIREMIKLTHGKNLICFAGGRPSPDSFPTTEIDSVISNLLATEPEVVLQYGDTQGCGELLEQLRWYMQSRGVAAVERNHLLVTSGSQQALDLIGRLLIEPGHVVLAELPSYIGATTAFHNLGADLVGVRQDPEGISLESLEGTLARLKRQRRPVAFLYTVPNFSNPSGVLMSRPRREALLEVAAEFDLIVVEDDAYGEIYFSDCDSEAVRPLRADDGDGRVIYTGTVSKTLSPGVRIGWICAGAEFIARLELIKQGADLFTSVLNQRVAAECLRRGIFQARLPKLRAYYERKRDAMAAALDAEMGEAARWNRPRGGFFLWLEAPPEVDALARMESAIEAGVAYIPGQPFFVDGSGANTLRLAYSSESEKSIQEGIRKLARFLKAAGRVKTPA